MALRTNDDYDHLFEQYGQVYNVDPLLIKTVFHLESRGNPNAPPSRNAKGELVGAQGGMQIMPKLAAHYGIDPHDITQAIPAAAAYLAEGLQATGGNPAGALAYYNGGPKTLQRLKPETQGYLKLASSYYPQMRLMGSAQAAPAQAESVKPSAAPSPDDEKAFRAEWGLPGGRGSSASAPDEKAFRAEWGITTPPPAPKQIVASDAAMSVPVAAVRGDPSVALNALGGDQFVPNPLAANPSQSAYSTLRSAVARDPALTYAQNAPVAMDAQGNAHLALPGSAHDFLSGAIDAIYGPRTGGMTPEATNALATGAMLTPGLMRSPANVPGRFTLFPRRASPDASAEAAFTEGRGNALTAAPAIESPAPSFGAGGGRSFEVDPAGNVTQPGVALAPLARPSAPPPSNPLATRAATEVGAPRAPGTAITYSPAERLVLDSIRTGAGANPAAAPPLGVPGYTPTTPGTDPSGLSDTELAAYASMRDAPPPSPMIPPMTKAAAEKHADAIIHHFHTGNEPTAPADLVLPPGYHPTLTGLTNDPGLATLHRGLESVDSTPAAIAQHNAVAVNAAAGKLQGNLGDAANMEAAVRAKTGPLFENAFANKTDMDPKKVQATIAKADDLLKSKYAVDPGVARVIQGVRNTMNSGTGNGGPVSDPELFHGTQIYLNNLLSPLAQNTDADKQAAASALMQIKPLVQAAIESGAKGFKIANDTHAKMMQPVDEQKFLESLNLTNAMGDVRLQAVDSAIKNIQKQQQLPGVPKAKWVSPEKLDQLVALRNALRMEASRGTGKPINSTTFQNLATNSMIGQIAGNPLSSIILSQSAMPGIPGALIGKGVESLTKGQLARSEKLVRDALVERLMNVGGKGVTTLSAKKAGEPRAPGAPWNPLNPGGPTPGPAATPPDTGAAPGAPWNMHP